MPWNYYYDENGDLQTEWVEDSVGGDEGTAVGDTDVGGGNTGGGDEEGTDTHSGGVSSGSGEGDTGGGGSGSVDTGGSDWVEQPADPEAVGYRVFKSGDKQVVIDPSGSYWVDGSKVWSPTDTSNWGTRLANWFKNPDGSINLARVASTGAGIGLLRSGLGGGEGGFFSRNTVGAPQGYTGTIPTKSLVREQVPYEPDPTRRPGAGGRQYFTSTRYVLPADAATARTEAQTQAAGIAALAKPKPVTAPVVKEPPETITTAPGEQPAPASDVINLLPVPKASLARGGVATLARGRYLNGATDGMADQIPANIEGKQEARLSHGEFVIPADVVSHLGNGNSEAGAQRLYDMMDKIRKARTGTPKQGKQINPDKFIPSRG